MYTHAHTCLYVYITISKGQNKTKFTPTLKVWWATSNHIYLQLTPRATRTLPGPCDAAQEAVTVLIYSLATPGSSVISTACLFLWSMPGGLWSDNLPLAASALWIHGVRPSPGHNSGHTMGTHNKRMVTVAAGTRRKDKEALTWREKKKAREGPGDTATQVAGQAEQLCCRVTGLHQEAELEYIFSLHDLYCKNKCSQFAQFSHFPPLWELSAWRQYLLIGEFGVSCKIKSKK